MTATESSASSVGTASTAGTARPAGTTRPAATLIMVSIDCDDPRALAEFYHQLLGWEITHSQDEYAMVSAEGNTGLGFGRVDGYQRPTWPDAAAPKQFHLDTYVDDLDQAEARCVELGATRPAFQPGGERWRVMLDPAGHPFCLCKRPQQ